MKGYYTNIEQATIDNDEFRHVLYTGQHTQLVLMSVEPGQSIGLETHSNDQFFRFEFGSGVVHIDDTEYIVRDGDCVIVPAGTRHNVTNTSDDGVLKLYTLYSPPHHRDGTTHATKDEADASHEEFDGTTTE